MNSNDYKRGYNEGLKAATEGKDKSFANSGNSWKFFLLGENAIKSYNEGYNAGYLDGLRKKSQIYQQTENSVSKSETKVTKRYNPGIRTGDNSFIPINHRINNIRSIKESIDYLITTYFTLIRRLEELKINYEKKLTQLNDEGLLDDLHDDIYFEYEQTASNIENLIYNIEYNDIANLKDVKDKVEDFENNRRKR